MDVYSRARELGIDTNFVDGYGHNQPVDETTLQAVLDAFAPSAGRRLTTGPIVVRSGQPLTVDFAQPFSGPLTWTLTTPSGKIVSGEISEPRLVGPADLPPGAYRLQLRDAAGTTDAVEVVVAPVEAFQGNFHRVWTLGAQLYALRSATNWGIGDFGDLQRLIALAADLGAAGIGLNPLHVLFGNRPADCSPYSPNSRLFLNPLYIDLAGLPELPSNFIAANGAIINHLQTTEQVDYTAVAELKFRALALAFQKFRAAAAPSRAQAFDRFRNERGSMLRRFACFEVLRGKLQTPWWEWPAQWHQPDDDALEALQNGDDSDSIALVEFTQWIADQQLEACRDMAVARQMPIGLYLDVAVGVNADGFDAWNEQSAISRHLSVGAPPDQLNTAGQDWGLAGFNPVSLERDSVQPFCDMLAASMRYAGAIRLDHVLGLKRLYLIPSGSSPRQGVFIRMPFDALLAATALQSQAFRCVVIGEDLGTVPEGFRDKLAASGIWSYRVMIFERGDHGAFRRAEDYAKNALVTFTTHDLPTFAGWRSGHDLDRKRTIGLDPGETSDQRHHAVEALQAAVGDGNGIDEFYQVIRFLSHSPSRVLDIALLDLLGGIDQPNIPGTVDEHPNWRQRLSVPLEHLPEALDISKLKQFLSERAAPSR